MSQNNIKFEINPLDINIAKIQHNLILRCPLEISDNNEFTQIEETYKSLDPTLDLSEIKVICEYNKNDSTAQKNKCILYLTISKKGKNDLSLELFNGTKQELMEYLNRKDFFAVIKSNVLN
jgi:hypothetical protein